MKKITTTLLFLFIGFASFALPITGDTVICAGTTDTLSDSTPGGTWISTDTTIATIGVFTGTATGISPGVVTIFYAIGSTVIGATSFTVNAAPGLISGATGVCVGAGITLAGAGGGTWSSSSTAVATVNPATGVVTGVSPGTTTITYSLGTGCSTTHTITVNPPPTLYTVTGGGSYCAGGPGAFHVGLSGSSTGVSYQLYNGGAATGFPLMGTGYSLDFGFQIALGIYTVSATSTATTCSSNMAGSATIAVNPLPNVHAITGGGSYCSGGTGVPVGLNNSDFGISYTLYNGTAPVSTVSGMGAALNFGHMTAAGIYSVVATNTTTGCTSNMMGTDTITINPLPAMFFVLGGGSYCSGGTGADIRLSGSAIGVTYQLYLALTDHGLPLSGTGDTLDFGPQTAAGAYAVVATAMGCSRDMGGIVNVSVNPLPTVYNVTGGGNICAGSAGVHIGLSGSNTGTSYQLFNGSSAVGGIVPGIGGAIDFGVQTAAGTYTVAAINTLTGCTNIMSGAATIAVHPLPVAYTVAGGGSYCLGGTGADISLSGSDAGTEYQLVSGSTPIASPLTGTGAAIDFGYMSVAGTYVIVATDLTTGCTNTMTGSAAVIVNPLPPVWTMSAGGGYCTGGSGIHIGLDGSNSGINYQLYRGGTTPVGSAVPSIGGPLDFGAETVAGSYTAVAINATTMCSVNMAGTATVSIDPLPAVHTVTGGGSYCGGGTGVAVGLNASNSGTSYELYRGTTAAGAVSGTGSAISFGNQTIADTYTVVAHDISTGCSSNMSGSAVISITTPVTPSVTISVSPGDTVCAGTTVTFTATAVNGGTTPTFDWVYNGAIVSDSIAFSHIPSNGDNIYVRLHSSAFCSLPSDTSSSIVTMYIIGVPTITGSPDACVSSTTSLSDSMLGGIWSSSNTGIATVSTIGGSTGVVTGIAVGIVNMTYTLSGSGCYSFKTITVNTVPSVTASASAVTCGGAYDLTASGGTTYSWMPSTGLACATCATTTSNPSATTVYTVTGYASGCSNTATVSVNGNRISGYISYAGAPTDTLKVWLIQFNPSDSSLIAIDSTLTCMDGGTPYYEFDGIAAGSYMVKAKLLGTIPGTSGYIPTYSLSTPYWYAAASTAHTSATDTMHINMVYGIVPPGPGFIGGLISAGAGRGTTGDIPAQGMVVYLVDAISNFVLTYTYTDASGAYSFSNIAAGNYLIYPEDFSFTTIPSPVIMLGSPADSATGIDFRQFNDSRVIRPAAIPSGIQNISASAMQPVSVFPNPTTGLLNIQWGNDAKGIAGITITDMTGREVYTTSFDIDAARSNNPVIARSAIDLGGLMDGIYIMSIKSDNINYSGKVVVER